MIKNQSSSLSVSCHYLQSKQGQYSNDFLLQIRTDERKTFCDIIYNNALSNAHPYN